MKPAPFDYVAPETIEDACRQLAEVAGGAAVLAGGQTLMPLLALRLSQPFILVDINRISTLKGVSRTDGGIRVGAMTRQSEIIADSTLATALPVLVTATRHVGHWQTRNRGTLGGSIALGEPAAELPATAVALGARVEVRSVRGAREIAAADLYQGPYSTALEPDELVTAIRFPEWPAGTLPLFREVARRPGDFALLGITGAITVAEGRIARAGIAWFGMGPTPVHARRVAEALVGQRVAALDVPALAELAIVETAPFDDHHATAEYRRTVARRIFARTVSEQLQLRRAA